MILSFESQGTEDIFNGKDTQSARETCPENLWRMAFRKLDLLDSVKSLQELSVPGGGRLVELSGDRAGQYGIQIDEEYQICFIWTDLTRLRQVTITTIIQRYL
jgi:proteic killer suppression protein